MKIIFSIGNKRQEKILELEKRVNNLLKSLEKKSVSNRDTFDWGATKERALSALNKPERYWSDAEKSAVAAFGRMGSM